MAQELTLYQNARRELNDILNSGAKSLKQRGVELMPIKPDMIQHPDCDLILECCNLLFAACLTYEAAHWIIDRAANPIELVEARIEAGRALGVVESLFFGPTAQLILTAMNDAPIAFYALSEASPDLRIIARCQALLNTTPITP